MAFLRGLPRGMWLVAALMAAPACTCGSCYPDLSGPDCSRFDFDFDADVDPACRPDARLPPHALGASLRFGICTLTCEPGWFDCNHETFDGCESTSCTDPLLEAGGPWAHTLSDAPLGLARCGDEVVFLDGNAVLAASTIDMSVRTVALLDLAPAGGVACANGFAVLPLRRSMEGGVDGRISRFRLNDAGSDAAPIDLERLVDPARSIDVDDAGGVFWIARTDAGPFVMQSALDASAMPLLPVDEPIIYKTFALHDGLWAISSGDVTHVHADGTVDVSPDAAAVAIASRDSGVSILTAIDGGAQLAGAAVFGVRSFVALRNELFIGADDHIVHVAPDGSWKTVVKNLPHLVDLVADDQYVYFTTLGPPATLSRAPW